MSDYDTRTYNELPLFRASDPETSQRAAAKTVGKLEGLQAEFVSRLQQLGRPSTANEVAAGNESIRKRAKECLDRSLIVEIGTKRCNVTGHSAMAYWIV